MSGIGDLAAFIAQARPDDIAASTMKKLRLHVLDTLGAWIGALGTAEGKALIKFRNDLRAMNKGAEFAGSLFDDVTINCALARLSEVDDIHLASMTTPGSIVIPAAMTMAVSSPQPNPGDVAAAILTGYEAMVRLGLAIRGPEILYRGIWPTYFGAAFGCAAVAARLLRLDETQTAHALTLALTMAAPSVGQHHAATTSRWLSVGNAARNGLTAAYAARSGFTSDTNILQSRLLPDVFGISLDIDVMSAGLGREVKLDEVSIKPWCAARQTMAGTQALRELIDDGIAVADIHEIAVSVPPPHLKMIDHGIRPGDRASRLTSLPYQMAVAALEPGRAFDISQSSLNITDAFQSFMALIKVSPDEGLLADYPAAWPARIVVTTQTGRRGRLVHDVPGDPARPYAEPDVDRKFDQVVMPLLGKDDARSIRERGSTALQSGHSLMLLVGEIDRIAA